MEITNARRVLAVCLQEEAQHLSKVLKDLTGSIPEAASPSLAGTTHDLALKTPYYNATVPVWIDTIAAPEEWSASFLSDEAKEVLAVLGGLILVFATPPSPSSPSAARTRELITEFGRVVNKGLGGWQWDGVGLAVGVGEGETDEWDDMCAGAGLEFVKVGATAATELNEFGEKTGIARIKEALESNDWAQLDDDIPSDFDEFQEGSGPDKEAGGDKDLDPESFNFGFDKSDFEGMRKAIWENNPVTDDDFPDLSATTEATQGAPGTATGELEAPKEEHNAKAELDDDDVVRVERMMRKLQAVREAGEGMGEEQRKRMAARAVKEVMADLD